MAEKAGEQTWQINYGNRRVAMVYQCCCTVGWDKVKRPLKKNKKNGCSLM